MRPDRHCGRPRCECTHEPPCDLGWIENPPRVKHGFIHESVRPCPICRPETDTKLNWWEGLHC